MAGKRRSGCLSGRGVPGPSSSLHGTAPQREEAGSLDVSAAGAALPPLFMPRGSCRVTRSAPPPASPKGCSDRNRSWEQERTTPSPRPSPGPCLHHSAPPTMFHPAAQTRVTLTPHPEVSEESYSPSQGWGWKNYYTSQARPVTVGGHLLRNQVPRSSSPPAASLAWAPQPHPCFGGSHSGMRAEWRGGWILFTLTPATNMLLGAPYPEHPEWALL